MNKDASSPEKSHNYSLPIVSLSSGVTGCALMPDDADVNPGVAQVMP